MTNHGRIGVWKLLSLLLQYPDAELLAGKAELAVAAAMVPSSPQREAIRRFLHDWCTADPIALQREYVETFDFNRRATLYLSFFAYGDRRQRGMAMLRLKQRYRAAGFALGDGELPDYLPAVLEFTDLAGDHAGHEALHELRPALELVRAALRAQGSRYAELIDAVCLALPALSPAEAERARELALQGPPGEEVGLEAFAPPEVMPPAPACAPALDGPRAAGPTGPPAGTNPRPAPARARRRARIRAEARA